MANKRNYEWPQASAWDGYFTQDKVGGATQRVDPSLVFERLRTEGFLDNAGDLIDAAVAAVAEVGYLTSVALDDLTDVNASSPTTGQILKWNGTAWVPANESGGGGGESKYQPTLPLPSCTSNVALANGSTSQWTAHGTILAPTGDMALVQNFSKLAVVCPQPVNGASFILAIYAWPSSGSTMTLVASSGVNTMPSTQSWLDVVMTSASVTLTGGEKYFAVVLWNGNGAQVAGVVGSALNVQPYIAFTTSNLGTLTAAPATLTPESESLLRFFLRLRA